MSKRTLLASFLYAYRKVGLAKLRFSIVRVMNRNSVPSAKPCPICGARTKITREPVYWPELVEAWGLSPEWAEYFDQQEGEKCLVCQSSLRSRNYTSNLLKILEKRTGAKHTTLRSAVRDDRIRALEIAEINSAGDLHKTLAKLPHLSYSEYGSTEVRSENLLSLSYANESFDMVLTSESLEHVPDVDTALREIHRVLKPGGVHIFTVPVVWDGRATRQRAKLVDGEIQHILPPSRHGSPNAGDDYLVFYEYGADFVQICENAGFDVKLHRDETNLASVTFEAIRI